MGFNRSADLKSYLHLRGFVQVLGLRSLVAMKQESYSCKEYTKSCEIFVNTDGRFLRFKFNELDSLSDVMVVKELE